MNTSQSNTGLQDRRSARRSTSHKNAVLWVGNHKAKIGVIEHTQNGARLMVRQALKVGDIVELLIGQSAFARRARVAWTTPLSVRDAVIAGFSFLED